MSDQENFEIVLQQRLLVKRQHSNLAISYLTKYLVQCWVISRDNISLKKKLSDVVDTILDDCEIFHNMDQDKSFDAMMELSTLSVVYVFDLENERIYQKICSLIRRLKASYVPGDFVWTEQERNYIMEHPDVSDMV